MHFPLVLKLLLPYYLNITGISPVTYLVAENIFIILYYICSAMFLKLIAVMVCENVYMNILYIADFSLYIRKESKRRFME